MITFPGVSKIPTVHVSLRLSVELRDRLEKAAQSMDLSVNDIAKAAIRAGVEAIEENDYRIEWPLKHQKRISPSRPAETRMMLNQDEPATPPAVHPTEPVRYTRKKPAL